MAHRQRKDSPKAANRRTSWLYRSLTGCPVHCQTSPLGHPTYHNLQRPRNSLLTGFSGETKAQKGGLLQTTDLWARAQIYIPVCIQKWATSTAGVLVYLSAVWSILKFMVELANQRGHILWLRQCGSADMLHNGSDLMALALGHRHIDIGIRALA